MLSDNESVPDSNRHSDPIRNQIERRLGYWMPEHVWEDLEQLGLIAEAELGPNQLDALEHFARNFTSSGRGPRKRPVVRHNYAVSPDERLKIVAELAAKEATEDRQTSVTAFRDRHLSGGVLAPDGVLRWLDQQAEQDGPPTEWRTLPTDANRQVLSDRQYERSSYHVLDCKLPASPAAVGLDPGAYADLAVGNRLFRIEEFFSHLDAAVVADSLILALVRTAHRGVLEELYFIVERLADRYQWDRGEATTFVLTGSVPSIPRIKVSRVRVSTRPQQWRIQLDIHPTTSPAEVLRVYREERRAAGIGKQRRKQRPLDLVYRFRQDRIDLPWQAVFDSWNAQYPEHCYSQVTNLMRDYRRAVELATGSLRPDEDRYRQGDMS
jgi:hypothetical protein